MASAIVGCMPSVPKFGSTVKESWSSKRSYLFSKNRGASTSVFALRYKESDNSSGDSRKQLGGDGSDLKNSSEKLDEMRILQP